VFLRRRSVMRNQVCKPLWHDEALLSLGALPLVSKRKSRHCHTTTRSDFQLDTVYQTSVQHLWILLLKRHLTSVRPRFFVGTDFKEGLMPLLRNVRFGANSGPHPVLPRKHEFGFVAMALMTNRNKNATISYRC
jgi:hypothetical protein